MKRLRTKNSITKKMVLPMLALIVLQAGLFLGTFYFGGTISQLNQNSFELLNERVINRKNYLQNNMVQRWSNLEEYVLAVNTRIGEKLKEEKASIADIEANSPLATELLESVTDDLIYMLRKQSVTGAFLILNGADGSTGVSKNGDTQKSGLYLRDMDPGSVAQDNSDVLVERAPASLAKKLGITMDSYWSPQFVFEEEDFGEQYDFFYKPFVAAVENPDVGYSDLGYWSRAFSLSGKDDIKIITYSVPLRSASGEVYGVLGVEISADYLSRQLPYDEVAPDKQGSYLLAIDSNEDMQFNSVLINGPVFKQELGGATRISFETEPAYQNSFALKGGEESGLNAYGCVQYLQLYNSNTPFEGERWALIGIVQDDKLLGFGNKVTKSMIAALAVALVLGILSVFFTSGRFTRPIKALVRQVKESDPHQPVSFDRLRISEIDELAAAIENLSQNVADSASKLSQIIDMTSLQIGAFEVLKKERQVSFTNHFFEILGIESDSGGNGVMAAKEFQAKLDFLRKYREEEEGGGETLLFKLFKTPGKPEWVRMRLTEDKDRVLGVVENVTQEIIEKRKIEYERDYDLLTNLLNRRAFHSILKAQFKRPQELCTAALLMFDLDNLKYINDTYGHDYGDQYIRCAANILRRVTPRHSIISRMSGDEFYVFIYGYEDKEKIRQIIEYMKSEIRDTVFPLPDNSGFRVRASAGVAWYPDDSDSYEQLIKYADFAMYTAKNTVKGEIREFSMENYQRNSYLLHNKEELNKFIDEELVEYHFQPIVDARTGTIFAYEALMRSKLPTLKSPMEILTLARSQSKLYQIERLTWFHALQNFAAYQNIPQDSKLFINSIANQTLSDKDIRELELLFEPYLSRVVLEITEEEKLDDAFVKTKQELIKRWYASMALDDFGAGYNGEAALLYLSPNFVKIDMSIIRDIDTDKSRQKILSNLLSYAHERRIKVIAEGVETKKEMATLIGLHIDYLQGFYLGVPTRVPQRISRKVLGEIVDANNENKRK